MDFGLRKSKSVDFCSNHSNPYLITFVAVEGDCSGGALEREKGPGSGVPNKRGFEPDSIIRSLSLPHLKWQPGARRGSRPLSSQPATLSRVTDLTPLGCTENLVEASVVPRGSVSMEENGLLALEDEHSALLESLVLLGGDPGLPARHYICQVPHPFAPYAPQHRQRRRGIKEGPPHGLVEVERPVTRTVCVGIEGIQWEIRLLMEESKLLRGAD